MTFASDESVPAPSTPHVVRIDSPRAMIEAVPHLVGFTPQSSLVVTFLERRADGVLRSSGAMRVDLPEPSESATWLASVVEPPLARIGPAAVIVSYWLPPTHGGRPRAAMLAFAFTDRALRLLLARTGITVLDVLAVAEDRFVSLLCNDASCCGDAGERWSSTDRSAISAELVSVGRPQPAGSREELAAPIAPDRAAQDAFHRVLVGLDAASLGEARLNAAGIVQQAMHEVIDTKVDGPDDDGVVRVALALVRGHGRDAAVSGTLELDGDGLCAMQAFWDRLVRATPATLRPAPAALSALTAYLRGEGARANVAIACGRAAITDAEGNGGSSPEQCRTAPVLLLNNLDAVFTYGLTPSELRELLRAVYSVTPASAE